MEGVPGVADLQVEQQTLIPHVEVRVLPGAARRFGLSSGKLRAAAATMIQGTKVGEIYDQQKIFDVTVRGIPEVRRDLGALRALRLDTPSGANIPLRDVTDIRIAPTPNSITHENGSRKIDITCNVRGRDLGSVAREIEEAVLGIEFDRGYHPEILGE